MNKISLSERLMGRKEMEANRYESLIQGKIKAKNLQEKIIQKYTQTDAGLVLAFIGIEHPASATVHRYLADQKYYEVPLKSMFIVQHIRFFIKRYCHKSIDNDSL